jgi:pilus assembly protein TadC
MSIDEQMLISQSLWNENGKLLAEKKHIRRNLVIWINMLTTFPFPLLIEKRYIAEYYDISLSYVINFCNNYRKRFAKINNKCISYQTFRQL